MERGPLREAHLQTLREYHLGPREAAGAVCLRYAAGETIIREGSGLDYFFVIQRGRAKICTESRDGKALILCYYISEGVMGDIELMNGLRAATTSVVAVADTECIALPYPQCAAPLKENPAFVKRLAEHLSAKLLQSSRSHCAAALCTAEERLCAYLLMASDRGMFREPLTDLAGSVGISYRHMMRLMTALCREGLLGRESGGYRLLDPRALRARASEFE